MLYLNMGPESEDLFRCTDRLSTPFQSLEVRLQPTTEREKEEVLAQTSITNHHRQGGLNGNHSFLRILEASSLRSRCQHGLVLMRALFQGTDCQLLLVSSNGGKRAS